MWEWVDWEGIPLVGIAKRNPFLNHPFLWFLDVFLSPFLVLVLYPVIPIIFFSFFFSLIATLALFYSYCFSPFFAVLEIDWFCALYVVIFFISGKKKNKNILLGLKSEVLLLWSEEKKKKKKKEKKFWDLKGKRIKIWDLVLVCSVKVCLLFFLLYFVLLFVHVTSFDLKSQIWIQVTLIFGSGLIFNFSSLW